MKQMSLEAALLLILTLSGVVFAYADPGGLAEIKLYRGDFVTDAEGTASYADFISTGMVEAWNTRTTFQLRVVPDQELTSEGTTEKWKIKTVNAYVGADPVPRDDNGAPLTDQFPYNVTYDEPADSYSLELDLEEDLGFRWGEPYEALRFQNICVHGVMVKVDTTTGTELETKDVWTFDPDFESAMASDDWEDDTSEITQALLSHWGTYIYEMAHPRRAHFIDSPVAGLRFETPTHQGKTDDSGAFDYFPGERTDLFIGDVYLGNALIDQKISPVDLFESQGVDGNKVINMARLLQSMDSDGNPSEGISINDAVEKNFAAAMDDLGLSDLDFDNDTEVTAVIDATISKSNSDADLHMVAVSKDEAKAHLDKNVSNTMFRKNISKTPELASAKAKMNVMSVWFPVMKANGDPATYLDGETEVEGIPYYDEDGYLVRTATEAKPLVIVYTDEVEETGAADVFAAVSRDDGTTWKRKNISRMADRSSFTLENGEEYYGDCKKPVFQVKDNKILIAWTSKFAKGGKPRYSIQVCPDIDGDGSPDACETCSGSGENETCGPDYTYDDDYYVEDIWGVSGPQRSVDYTDQGYPEVGEVPYSAVWVARGIIATEADVENGVGEYAGDIVWFKPERLTSARRDANQVFMGGADSAGFAIAWQEDPEGLRPGEAKGPGPGWGGATTNHKTDIWYSYITWDDFAEVDFNFVSGGDPEHDVSDDEDFMGRPKALVPMSLPVRVSDNDAVNTDNLMVELDEDGYPAEDEEGNWIPTTNTENDSEGDGNGDGSGSHSYGYTIEGLCEGFYQFTNMQEEVKRVCITDDDGDGEGDRLLDGNTGASRPNLFLQTYTKSDGTKSAWAIMAYEESKGVGLGPDEDSGSGGEDSGEKPQDGSGYDPYESFPDAGKNVIYHSFDFQSPDLVSAGTILNLPETDDDGNPLTIEQPLYSGSELINGEYVPIANPSAGEKILDFNGEEILAYENARRPRFILQSKSSAFGGTTSDGSYKNPENSGTVLLVLYKEGEEGSGHPSDIMVRRCVVKDTDGSVKKGNPWSPDNFLPGAQNVSTVTPIETWINPERDEDAKGEGTKVCSWEQPEENLALKSGVNPYEDARAHRGAIRGDFVILGYSYTPNWAASRNAHDKYDFYVRRSFDGGATWTTDPASDTSVVHTDYFINPEGVSGSELDEEGNDASEATKHYTVDTEYAGGGVYEPARNVSLLKNNKTSVIEPRIVAVPGTIKTNGSWTGIAEDKQDTNVFYLAYGTSTNLKDVEKAPEDLFLTFSQDKGTTLFEDEWVVNPDSSGKNAGETVTGWIRLAKGDPEQGEVQIRMTPNGERFYGCWLEEGEEGSDIFFRRLTPAEFPTNKTLDLNNDGSVTYTDLYVLKGALGSSVGDAKYNKKCDYDLDGTISYTDYQQWYGMYRSSLLNR